jgi:hypothetical protein
MKKLLSSLTLATAAIGAYVVGGTGVASAAVSAAVTTCGAGYVCIYKGDIWDGGSYHPMAARYYNYGTYNLSNMIGDYTVKNCQTGGAGVAAYSGYRPVPFAGEVSDG